MSETAVNGVEPIIFLDDVHVTFRTRTGSILHPNLVHAVHRQRHVRPAGPHERQGLL